MEEERTHSCVIKPTRLDSVSIKTLLIELADELDSTEQTILCIVGGAHLALSGLRESTRDIDSITPLSGVVKRAIENIARRNDLPSNWLNDHARAFAPTGPFVDDVVLFEHRRLKVTGLSLRDIFLMKLARAAANDVADMRVLWPRVAAIFGSTKAVVRDFYRAFPQEPFDKHLEDFVASVVVGRGEK